MTVPYNPPVQQRIGLGRILNAEPEELQILRAAPVWKPIGEASISMGANGLYIERIDGTRIPVTRHGAMPSIPPTPPDTTHFDVDATHQDQRIQRDLLLEAYRQSLEMADYKAASEFKQRYERAEDEMRRRETQIKREAFRRVCPSSPFNFNPFW
jgi:hypothetical protein